MVVYAAFLIIIPGGLRMNSFVSVDALQKFSLFHEVSASTLGPIAAQAAYRQFAPGELLFREGEADPILYLVVAGSVKVFKTKQDQPGVFLRRIGAGEAIGLTSLFKKRRRSATLIAESETTLIAVPHKAMVELIEDRENSSSLLFIESLIEHLASKVREKNSIVARLTPALGDERISIAVFDSKPYTQETLLARNRGKYAFSFFEPRLSMETARLAEGFSVVCAFVNDDISGDIVRLLRSLGVRHIALRCAGFNNVDRKACREEGILITRVPAYSPHAVAEHAVALILGLNRKIHRAYNRVREGNFRLEGLVGFDLFGKTVGIIGTGKIGKVMAGIMKGFGCSVIAYDLFPDQAFAAEHGVQYRSLHKLIAMSDIISLHAPLTQETHHIINEATLAQMKDGVVIINTSRGGLIDTRALIIGLKSGKIGAAGLDVYEEEADFFFEDFSGKVITDDVLARLLTFNNVLITSHQAFLTHEALDNIAETVINNITLGLTYSNFDDRLPNQVVENM